MCEYCKEKDGNKALDECYSSEMSIEFNNTYGFYEIVTCRGDVSEPINFCPMCGRKLGG